MDPDLACCFLKLEFFGASGLWGSPSIDTTTTNKTATSHRGGSAACMTGETMTTGTATVVGTDATCHRVPQTCDVSRCRPVVFMAARLDPKGASTRGPRLDIEPVPELKVQKSQR